MKKQKTLDTAKKRQHESVLYLTLKKTSNKMSKYKMNKMLITSYSHTACGLQACVNRAHFISWQEVVKAISNQGVDCFVSWGSFFCFSFVFRALVCHENWTILSADGNSTIGFANIYRSSNDIGSIIQKAQLLQRESVRCGCRSSQPKSII